MLIDIYVINVGSVWEHILYIANSSILVQCTVIVFIHTYDHKLLPLGGVNTWRLGGGPGMA